MNEKNSAKAGGPSGTEAAGGDDSAAAKAADGAAERTEGTGQAAAHRTPSASAGPEGSNSGPAEPAQDRPTPAERPDRSDRADQTGRPIDQADRADRADKTLVFTSPASRQDSARPAADRAVTADDGDADDGHAGNRDAGRNEEEGEKGKAAAGTNSGSAAPASTPASTSASASSSTSATPPRDGKPEQAEAERPETAAPTSDAATLDVPESGAPIPEAEAPKAEAPESQARGRESESSDAGAPEPQASKAGAEAPQTEGRTPEQPESEARAAPADSDPAATPAATPSTAPAAPPVSDPRAVPARTAKAEPESKATSEPDSEPVEKPTPSWAARRESDSERTSEFVALKPDLPHPAPPRRAVPVPPPPSVGTEPGQSPSGPEVTREFNAPRAVDDRTMALTRPPAPSATPPAAAPPTAPGGGDAGGPPPPLDLLAQLTNTPPKPETVARTVGRRIKIWGTLVALVAVVLVVVQALRPLPTPTLQLTAKSTHTADGGALSLPWPSEGQAVVDINGLGRMGTYGEMKPLPIGSVAKVMTSYLILRDHPLKAGDKGPSIPIDQKAQDDYTNGVKEKESVVEVKAGRQVSELEALQAVMLPSANNVARLLARWDASTEEAFIKKMNDTAKELGMTNTTYTDASGLEESTVSTAEDQVKLAKRAMADPIFRTIAKLPSYTSTTTSGGGTVETARTQHNFNKLVPLNGVVGIKTGSTTKAGGNLLFAAETTVGDSKQLVIGAVFGQHRAPIIDTATAASKKLILAADKALRSETVVKKGDVVGRVDDGLGGTVPVVATKDLSVPVWSGASVAVGLTDGGKTLPHSAKAGTQVGTLTVGTGTGEVKVPVALKDDLVEPSFGAKLTRIG
ncbi:D-alanyl-D-alanine carboxypeptidase [Streptomyces sp. NPDC056670]|uniref:D-alanyl-D-alanine carboxypeptidase n=1 Tax=Streptomyces sp. NPDC056670 TaxID=3345904 RepID=UPI0036CB70EA